MTDWHKREEETEVCVVKCHITGALWGKIFLGTAEGGTLLYLQDAGKVSHLFLILGAGERWPRCMEAAGVVLSLCACSSPL